MSTIIAAVRTGKKDVLISVYRDGRRVQISPEAWKERTGIDLAEKGEVIRIQMEKLDHNALAHFVILAVGKYLKPFLGSRKHKVIITTNNQLVAGQINGEIGAKKLADWVERTKPLAEFINIKAMAPKRVLGAVT